MNHPTPTPTLKLAMMPVSERPGVSPNTPQVEMVQGLEHEMPWGVRHDQLRNMVSQEKKDGYKCYDYFSFQFYSSEWGDPISSPRHFNNSWCRDVIDFGGRKKNGPSKKIDESCRTSICEWMYRVVDHFGVDRMAVSIATSYIDRILSTNYCADRKTFKLISSTALSLAIKMHYAHMWYDVGRLLPDLSRGDFVLDDLIAMESELVHSLSWLLNPPTGQNMAMYILSLLPNEIPRSVRENITDVTLFLIELSVCDYYFVTMEKSIIAMAAILNATETMDFEPVDFRRDIFSDQTVRQMHIEKLMSGFDLDLDWDVVSKARDRLWSLYRHSTETTLQQRFPSPICHASNSVANKNSSATYLQGYPSPTSVVTPTNDFHSAARLDNYSQHPNRKRVYSDYFSNDYNRGARFEDSWSLTAHSF